jgi:hypothetical protein
MKYSFKMFRFCGSGMFLLAALSVLPLLGYAALVPIGPSGSTFTIGDSGPLTGGSVAADTGNVAFSSPAGSGSFSGTFDEQVYKTAGGTLDFLYQFSISAATPTGDKVTQIAVNDFAGFTTSVGTDNTLALVGSVGTIAPTYIYANGGGTINFLSSGVGVGQVAETVIVATNATAFSAMSQAITFQDGAIATVNGYTPVVPEPFFAGLFLSGIFGVGILIARRFRVLQS